MTKRATILITLALLLGAGLTPAAAQDGATFFNDTPTTEIYTVTRSVLKSLGWDIDKEDRAVGWIRTDSRRLDGENFGVYAKGVKHRLRVVINRQDANRSTVTVERRVYKEERILFVDKEEDIKTDIARSRRILDEIVRILSGRLCGAFSPSPGRGPAARCSPPAWAGRPSMIRARARPPRSPGRCWAGAGPRYG